MDPKTFQAPVTIETVYDESYKATHIDGAYFLLNDSFGQFMIYYDDPVLEYDENGEFKIVKVNRHFIGDFRMSPATFQDIARQLYALAEQRTPEQPDNPE